MFPLPAPTPPTLLLPLSCRPGHRLWKEACSGKPSPAPCWSTIRSSSHCTLHTFLLRFRLGRGRFPWDTRILASKDILQRKNPRDPEQRDYITLASVNKLKNVKTRQKKWNLASCFARIISSILTFRIHRNISIHMILNMSKVLNRKLYLPCKQLS